MPAQSDDLGRLLTTAASELAHQRPESALAMLDSAIHIDTDSPRAHCVLGDCYTALKKHGAALASYDRAIALQPGMAAAHSGRAGILLREKKYAPALASALRSTTLAPGHADGWAALGRILGKLRQYEQAAGAYRTALAIDPDLPFLKGRLLQQLVLACDWTDIAPLIEDIERDLAAGKPSARPFVWNAVATSPRSLQLCAERFGRDPAAIAARRPAAPRPPGDRIRVGYVSGEFRDHSISFHRVGVFEHHDRDRFEIVGFDNGWDDGHATRGRINAAMDRIIPIRGLSDEEAAAAIRREAIDILVDLNGYTGLNRIGVIGRRPAPVQVNLPGFPGTLGVDHLDYIIADATVLPPAHAPFFSEQPVHLPDSYQPNDRTKAIADRAFTRAELGLPEQSIVFCCFNSTYKIMPATFDSWARILTAVEGSVLWLMQDNDLATANLRREAQARGIDPARLIFADRLPSADHLARHRAADLFLDTLPCNAHATASDALWAGLPVLTCPGDTFPGRVAASLLTAIGLPDLIQTTTDDYERTAIALATDPGMLARIRQRLADNRLTMPLFDTARYTRHLEQAYIAMHERHIAGLPPAPIAITG